MIEEKQVKVDSFDEEFTDTNEWAVSYGDVISLLLVFFILLLSAAELNNSKVEKMSKALKGEVEETTSVEELKQDIREILASNGMESLVAVEDDELGVNIIIKDKFLFSSGSANISVASVNIVSSLFESFKKLSSKYRFEIEGHTDDVPISTALYPSNWHLSSARALAMLEFFIDKGFAQSRFAVQGFADNKPLFPNRDEGGSPLPENRAKNRRVVINVR